QAGQVPLYGSQLPQSRGSDPLLVPPRRDPGHRRARPAAGDRGRSVRPARLRRRADARTAGPAPRRRAVRQHVLQDVRARPARRLGTRPARGTGEAGHRLRGADPVPEHVRADGRRDVLRHDAVEGTDQDVPADLPGAPGRAAVRADRTDARRYPVDPARRRLLRLADAARRAALEGDAAAGDRRPGRLRSVYRVLRRRHRWLAPAPVVLLPDARADPRRGTAARRGHREGEPGTSGVRHGLGTGAVPGHLDPRDAARPDRRSGSGTRTGMIPVMEPHVLILAGGLSYEREVSLRSGRRVLDALRAVGVDAAVRDADVTLLPALQTQPPDAVIIALHGSTGEDGSLRGVLDLCGIPYVGSDAQSARVAWDKPSAKAVLREAGIPTPDWVALPHDRFSELGAAAVLDRI